jgi:hypothetical protein
MKASIAFVATVSTASSAQIIAATRETSDLIKTIIELMGSPDLKQTNSAKAREFASNYEELQALAKARQPLALFHYGWFLKQLCVNMKEQGIEVSSAPTCVTALEHLRTVAEDQRFASDFVGPAAQTFLAEAHRDGIGTRASRYLAADWFTRSAQQRQSNGDRDGAVRAMEEALKLVPDHSPAIKLKSELFQ